MGIIDSNRFDVECSNANCGRKESVAVHEKGSAYGSSWQSGKDMEYFDATWEDVAVTGPLLVSAICRTCQTQAIIKGPHS